MGNHWLFFLLSRSPTDPPNVVLVCESWGKPNDPDFEKEVLECSEDIARPLEIMYPGCYRLSKNMLATAMSQISVSRALWNESDESVGARWWFGWHGYSCAWLCLVVWDLVNSSGPTGLSPWESWLVQRHCSSARVRRLGGDEGRRWMTLERARRIWVQWIARAYGSPNSLQV